MFKGRPRSYLFYVANLLYARLTVCQHERVLEQAIQPLETDPAAAQSVGKKSCSQRISGLSCMGRSCHSPAD